MNKLVGHALAKFEAGRNVWQEVLDSAREIRAGGDKRIVVEPRSRLYVRVSALDGPKPCLQHCWECQNEGIL